MPPSRSLRFSHLLIITVAICLMLFSGRRIVDAQSGGASSSKTCNPSIRGDCPSSKPSATAAPYYPKANTAAASRLSQDDKRRQSVSSSTSGPEVELTQKHSEIELEDLRTAIERMDQIMRLYFGRIQETLTSLQTSINGLNQTVGNLVSAFHSDTSGVDFGNGGNGNSGMCNNQARLKEETQFRIVCHFINWGSDRKEGVFIPEDVDLNLCTHINYAFASLDPSNLLIKEGNVFVDIRNNFYQRLTSRKQRNPRLKILLSLGGYVDSAGDKYSRLARNVTARRIFKEDVIIFLRKHGFDGLNIQWQYPSCWQSNCDNSPPEDRQNFVQWLQELREAFDRQRPRLLLTVSVSKSSLIISHAYDVPALARVVDYINVMTYDYPGVSTDLRTRHPAPLYYSDGYSDDVFSVNASMHYWLKSGAPANKLIMEIQTYGRSFTLSNPRQTGLNAPARTEGRPGEISNELGKLAYFEICQRVKNRGWTKRADSLGGSYAYSGDQWVAYDDIEDVVRKARYVKDNNFGGIGVWDTSMDDFKPMCCRVANPLLNAVTYVLRGIGTEAKDLGCD